MKGLTIALAVLWLGLAAAAALAEEPSRTHFSPSFSLTEHQSHEQSAAYRGYARFNVPSSLILWRRGNISSPQSRHVKLNALPFELPELLGGEQKAPSLWRFRLTPLDSARSRPRGKSILSLRAVPMNGVSQAHWHFDPAFSQTAYFQPDPGSAHDLEGGFLAVDWWSGSYGVTFGGGYTRVSNRGWGSYIPTARRSAASMVRRLGSGSSADLEIAGRWSAYFAVPYRLTDRLGLRPEITYSQWDAPTASDEIFNEWVMGLNVSFGF